MRGGPNNSPQQNQIEVSSYSLTYIFPGLPVPLDAHLDALAANRAVLQDFTAPDACLVAALENQVLALFFTDRTKHLLLDASQLQFG